ncbi:MAG: hypothetical protein ACUVQ0_01795 [Thermoproteota archaeon]
MGFKPETIMYWTRVALGALLGVVNALFWRPPFSLLTAFSIALLIYTITYRVFKWKFRRETLTDKDAPLKEGIASFFLTWLFTWFFLYNVLFSP